jgi:hypothetical protein
MDGMEASGERAIADSLELATHEPLVIEDAPAAE